MYEIKYHQNVHPANILKIRVVYKLNIAKYLFLIDETPSKKEKSILNSVIVPPQVEPIQELEHAGEAPNNTESTSDVSSDSKGK